MRSVIFLRAEK